MGLETAAATIGASMISAVLRPIADKAADVVLDQCDFMVHIKREIYNLRNTLLLIETVIQDAEEKQVENVHIYNWLRQLVDIGYEARDVLDEFVTVSASVGAKGASRSVKCRSLPYFCFSICSGSSSVPVVLPFQFRFRIVKDIRKVHKRLDDMTKQKEIVRLLEFGGGGNGGLASIISPRRRHEAGPFGNKQRNNMFVGREDVKKKIMEKLIDHNNNRVHLIPILGMGGVGKTTLARFIYTDDEVKKEYPNRRWLSVGEKKFNAKNIISRIIREPNATSNCEDAEDFQEKLVEKFQRDKFLIVLDDVWDLDSSQWKSLWDPLTNVRNGGFIIITTRLREVITATNTPVPEDLKPLSYEDCWLIFESHAFVDGNSDIRSDLKCIGQQIVKKLNGLPLAAEVVGRSLLNGPDVEEWTSFLNNRDWKLRNNEDDVMSTLRWSYNRLPPHLKQCFAYCSLFPKDHVFDEKVLVEMWMAHDFIQNVRGGETQRRLEDTGILYFKELVYASLFQCVDGKYMMHDMIHDLAMLVSNEEFAIVNSSGIQMEKNRHLTIICDPNYMNNLRLCKSKRILTLYTTPCPEYISKATPSINKDVFDIFKQLKSIRVLVLFCSKITYIPDCVSDLRHLRYLDLSKTSVRCLPDSLCDLHNLQTLATPLDAVLPKDIVNMTNLRHLRANLTTCNGFGKLTSLQELSSISVCEDGDIGALREMRQLRGKLIINGLENVINLQDVDRNMMQDKSYIDQLELVFNEDLGKTTIVTEVLNALSCPPNLSDLKIAGYSGLKSPSWMVDGKLIANLHTLKLSKCHQLELLPPLGELNSLKSLHLDSMPMVRRLGDEFYGKGINGYMFFPSLEMFELKNMLNWKEWGDIIIKDTGVVFFPCLKNLFIFDCPILVSVLPPIGGMGPPTMNAPNVMRSLSYLRIRSCRELMLLKLDTLVSLKDLSIRNCSDLTTITSAVHVGATIETLLVEFCGNLKRMEFESLPSLKILSLVHCNELISVPRLVAIEDLTIRACENLRSLSINLEELDSLEKMLIYQCPVLELISDEASTSSSSASSSLPMSRLWSLQTDNRLVFTKVFEHNLVSLTEMWIKCFIGVERFSVIEENNWHKLTLLQTLHISDCEDLKLLPPEFQKLSSLKSFYLSSCPQLQSLPAGGLPLSLEKLKIIDCPMLYERCEVDSGCDWQKIKHIRERTIGSW